MIIILNKVLWGLTTIMILVSGIYFSIKLNYIQFNFFKIITHLLKADKKTTTSISPLESLNMALAAKIGVGSLAGIALSLYVGGSGTIFWIWVSAFLSAPNTFSETILGVIYRQKDEKNIYRGGPPYYIKYGLGKNPLAYLSAFFILLTYIVGFLTIQANTIVRTITNLPAIVTTLAIVIISGLIIFKGVKQIAIISNYLVPLMGSIYIISALFILIININKLSFILISIIKNAFNFKATITGFVITLIIGIQRGIFSNEAGLGTSAIASATTSTNKPVPVGFIQMFGVYFTTLLICTMTALVILTSNYQSLQLADLNGIEITLYAFKYHLGTLGEIIVIITIILFSFSTIISGYYYGESCLKFMLRKVRTHHLFLLRLITLILLFIGSLTSSLSLWRLIDIVVAITALINLYALLLLKKDVFIELENYNFTRKK